jgi:hypothetical protein
MLDLCLFGLFKTLKNRTEDIKSRVNLTVHIPHIITSLQEASTVPRIQTAFRRGGFGVNASMEPGGIKFSEVQLRNSKESGEMWRIDDPLEKLSRRRQFTSY